MKTIPVALPLLGQAEADAASRTILSGWVTQGPRVAEFEADFVRYTGAAHACAVANCTVALHYALLAVGVRPGDTVITVSHSFIATANAVRACGAEPVFADIDPATLNPDERTAYNLTATHLGMVHNLTTAKSVERLRAEVVKTQQTLPLAKTLEAMKGE